MDYNSRLDGVTFRRYTIPKKNGSRRVIFEVNESSKALSSLYYNYPRTVAFTSYYRRVVQRSGMSGRLAYCPGVSIQDIVLSLEPSNFYLQMDIKDFFNTVPIPETLQRLVPKNYYYDPIKKIGMKQGCNISGQISNMAMEEFDSNVLENISTNYVRYADDIIIGFETKEEAEEARTLIEVAIERMGMQINTRKTVITDLSEPGDRYVKYLGIIIKRDKLDTTKMRLTYSRKNRPKWWCKNTIKYTQRRADGSQKYTFRRS